MISNYSQSRLWLLISTVSVWVGEKHYFGFRSRLLDDSSRPHSRFQQGIPFLNHHKSSQKLVLTSVQVRKEANIHHPFPMAALYRQEDMILTPYVPETDWEDYSGVGMPSNHIGCGPIMLPSAISLVDSDSDLAIWLKQAPTILLNLGTHFSTDMTSAVEISKGLKFVLETLAEVQVLWKLKYDWQDNQEITRMLQPFLDAKRLRITPWLTADPATILLEGHVVCSVHHGGANSYYEACR